MNSTTQQTQNPQLVKWLPALQDLFQSRPDLHSYEVLSATHRNLVVNCQTQTKQRTVFKISNISSSLKSEYLCLSEVIHPNIVSMKGAHSTSDFLFVELEKVPGKSVIDLILEEGKFSETESLKIFKQMVSAVSFLHSKGWVHRDIKPDNMMYDKQTGKMKLIDFELATPFQKGHTLKQVVGSFRYLSPEVRCRSYEGPESDAWSLGVTLFVMLTGHFPFSDQEISTHTEFKREIVVIGCSREVNDLVKQLLALETSKRLSVDQILNHPWLKRRDSRMLKLKEDSKPNLRQVFEMLRAKDAGEG